MQRYVGKPYNFRRYNCYHHVSAVRKDFGIETKMFKARTLDDAFELITAQMSTIGNGFALVDKPQNFDVVFVEKKHKGRKVYHCGVYHDGYVSHCCNIFGSVRHQELSEFKKGYTGVTFWR
jgi:hypothetical protein